MKLKVTYSDGKIDEVVVGPRAQVAFERNFNVSLDLADRVEHVYYLAWAALHFAGREPKDFDAFLDKIEDVDPVKKPGDEDVDPTPPDQPMDESSPSA